MGHGLPPTWSDLFMMPQVHCENPRRVCVAPGRAAESLQGVGQEEDPAHRSAGETELGSLGTPLCLCGDHLSAPCLGTAPGRHSCQQHFGSKLNKPLACHETWKLCALWVWFGKPRVSTSHPDPDPPAEAALWCRHVWAGGVVLNGGGSSWPGRPRLC